MKEEDEMIRYMLETSSAAFKEQKVEPTVLSLKDIANFMKSREDKHDQT